MQMELGFFVANALIGQILMFWDIITPEDRFLAGITHGNNWLHCLRSYVQNVWNLKRRFYVSEQQFTIRETSDDVVPCEEFQLLIKSVTRTGFSAYRA